MNIISASFLTILSLGILLVAGYFLSQKFQLSAEYIPFTTISVTISYLFIVASLDFLKYGTFILYLITFLYFIYIIKNDFSSFKNYLYSYEIKAFYLICLLFIVFFAIKMPFFFEHDEMTHWGPFLKSMKETGRLHIFLDQYFMQQDYPQGLSLFAYFFSFLVPEFKEELCFSAYAIIIVACSLILLPDKHNAPASRLSKLCLPLMLVSLYFLFPWLLPYGTVYPETILASYFVATFLMILKVKDYSSANLTLLLCNIFSFLQVKNTAIVFSLICLAAFFLRYLFFEKEKLISVKSATICGALLISFAWWKILLKLTAQNSGLLSNLSISAFFLGIMDYFKNGPNHFSETIKAFINAIFHRRVLFNDMPAVYIFLFLLVLTILAIIKNSGIYDKLVLALLPVCFFCYLFVLLITYAIIFSPAEAYEVNEFSRYVSGYMVGWLMILIYYYFKVFKPYTKLHTLIICFTLVLSLNAMFQHDLLRFRSSKETVGRTHMDVVASACNDYIGENKNIWLVTNTPILIYRYHYLLMPNDVNIFMPMAGLPDVTCDFVSEVKNNDIDYILLVGYDDAFAEKYSDVFNKTLPKGGQAGLYSYDYHNNVLKLLKEF